jgi:hypothetical protein
MKKSNFKEPELIKAGDERLKLGVFMGGQPPLVDCRVVAEDNYQTLMSEIKEKDLIIEELEAKLKRRDARIELMMNPLKKKDDC